MKYPMAACITLTLATLAGCASDGHGRRALAESQPQIDVVAPNREIVVGDSTTLTVTSKNTLGREAQVQWDTTGGNLTTQDNGRVARVRFDKPGSYTVNAKLIVDGRVYDQDSVTIEAMPLR